MGPIWGPMGPQVWNFLSLAHWLVGSTQPFGWLEARNPLVGWSAQVRSGSWLILSSMEGPEGPESEKGASARLPLDRSDLHRVSAISCTVMVVNTSQFSYPTSSLGRGSVQGWT